MRKIQLTIPDPCHENWDDMTQVEKGRYCNSCQKTVIDFSQMTDAQLGAFFRKPVGSYCGRLHEDQLDREIVIPRKKIPWVKYFFQIALPAFLVSLKSYSQKQSSPAGIVQTKPHKANYSGNQEIKGQVLDSTGASISFATISIKNSTRSVASDEKGNFELRFGSEERILIVSAIGYETTEFNPTGDYAVIVLKQKVHTMEPVVITGYDSYRKGGVRGVYTDKYLRSFPTIRQIVDTVFSNISIYPNPVSSNSVISIKTNKVEEGNYLATIFDGKGSVVQLTSVSFQEKNAKVELPIGNVASGSYFLHLRNKTTGKQYTKKLIVQ